MRNNFLRFSQLAFYNFSHHLYQFLIFIPYFFSTKKLLLTLFYPWKNLVATKTEVGISFEKILERISFNLISRMIGFFCRLSILFFTFFVFIIYLFFLPIIILIFIILLPFNYLIYLAKKTPEEKKQKIKEIFIKNHLLDQKNLIKVDNWFETIYQSKKDFDLFSIPPIARDWAVGYTPILNQYVEELTTSEYQNKIKTCFDREKEIEEIIAILSKSDSANVVVVGDEGVGKHTIIDSLAKAIYEGKTNTLLNYKRLLKINLEKILNLNIDQKKRESILESLFQEAALAKNIILLIEDFDRYLINQGERVDLSLSISKYARTNQIQFIGITEPFFYQKIIYPNEKIRHLFEKIDVYEIKKDDALKILMRKIDYYENHYQLFIPYETLEAIIEKSEFFITDIPFPEKALQLLDLVCIEASKQQIKKPDPHLVNQVLFKKTHIPTELTQELRTKLINLENLLYLDVLQQEEAIKKVASAMRRSFLLIGKRKKPIGSFLFLGPTGVGKTQTAKSLANIFFGSDKYLFRFDMSNYQSKSDISILLDQLTISIRQNPYGVLLLDEFEKADQSLINIFLTIFDEGYFTNHRGEKIDAKNLIIIATSNAANDVIYQRKNIQETELIDYLIKNKFFSPELLNRFDAVIIFQTLNLETIKTIAKKYLEKISQEIKKNYQVNLSVSDDFLNQLVQKEYQPMFGARNLFRVIQEEIENKVAKIIIEKKVKEGDNITL